VAAPTAPAASPAALRQAAGWLDSAKAPVVLLGGGAQDAGPLVRALVEKLDAPAIMTVNARGVLAPDHPLGIPASPSMPPVQRLIEEADIILAIGAELGSTDFDWFEQGGAKFNGRSIRIDIDPQQLVRTRQPDLSIVSDASEAAAALAPLLTPQSIPGKRNGAARAAATRDKVLGELSRIYRAGLHLMETVRDTLPGAVLVGDSAQPVYAGCTYYPSAAPRSWFCSATGYGTLGYALPAAIGAHLGAPDRPAVCIIGDGGIQFTIQELASAREIDAPVIILLWNNNGYGEIKTYMVARQIHPIGVDIYTPDFQLIGKGFGCETLKLKNAADLPAQLRAAAARKKPTIIEIDEGDYVAGFEG
jgi:acetolactate synthase-1/2/3 large subunit